MKLSKFNQNIEKLLKKHQYVVIQRQGNRLRKYFKSTANWKLPTFDGWRKSCFMVDLSDSITTNEMLHQAQWYDRMVGLRGWKIFKKGPKRS